MPASSMISPQATIPSIEQQQQETTQPIVADPEKEVLKKEIADLKKENARLKKDGEEWLDYLEKILESLLLPIINAYIMINLTS